MSALATTSANASQMASAANMASTPRRGLFARHPELFTLMLIVLAAGGIDVSFTAIAVLIISDDLPELLQNCDRILLMRKGHLAGEYAAANLEEAALYRALVGEDSQEVAA